LPETKEGGRGKKTYLWKSPSRNTRGEKRNLGKTRKENQENKKVRKVMAMVIKRRPNGMDKSLHKLYEGVCRP